MTEAPASAATDAVEVRITGGIYSLNRFLMTLQSKRVPLKNLTVRMDGGGIHAGVLFDCPPEAARRYVALLAGLEDVREVRAATETMEVALLKVVESPRRGDSTWRGSAAEKGIEAHEDGGTIVASGDPEKMEAWLANVGEDAIRLGPVARPGTGGD